MKKFLKKIALFLLIFSLVNMLIFSCIQRESIGLTTENQKIAFVETSTVAPKILISGGSNVGYSLDTEVLAKKLDRDVFNISFSISHGYEFPLNYIASNLKKGDIFIYIPEYDHYYVDNENLMSDALSASIYNTPSFFQYLSFAQKVDFITKMPKFNILFIYKNLKNIFLKNSKSALELNSRGDYIHHLNKPQTWKKTKITRYEKYDYNGKLSDHFKDQLLQAKELAMQNGASFYVSFPAIAASQYDKRFKEDVEKFYKNSSISIIGTQENYIFQDSLIYDHPYHTTRKGRTMRTELLVKDIQKLITKN